MERTTTQNISVPEVEDPGEEPDEGDERGRTRSHRVNERNSSVTNSNLSLPPAYPCTEVCAHCGKKISDDSVNDNAQQGPEETGTTTTPNCPCECHKQALPTPQKPLTQMHIPPGGPNCLPGCGYSGLPCYNCTSFQNYLQSTDPSVQRVSQGFPTQIYTVELVNPASRGSPSPDDTIFMPQNEDSPEARMRRRTCISLVMFIITLNVAIAIFRMLSGSSIYYG